MSFKVRFIVFFSVLIFSIQCKLNKVQEVNEIVETSEDMESDEPKGLQLTDELVEGEIRAVNPWIDSSDGGISRRCLKVFGT